MKIVFIISVRTRYIIAQKSLRDPWLLPQIPFFSDQPVSDLIDHRPEKFYRFAIGRTADLFFIDNKLAVNDTVDHFDFHLDVRRKNRRKFFADRVVPLSK